jgi:hypothetical protein
VSAVLSGDCLARNDPPPLGFGAAGESTRIGKSREPRIMRMTRMPQVLLGGKLCRASAAADAKSRWIGLSSTRWRA